MPDAPATAALPHNPGPAPNSAPDRAANPAPTSPHAGSSRAGSSRAGRALSLLYKLIDYGHDLIDALQERATARTLLTATLCFGTTDIALIFTRIMRGLHLACVLRPRLIRQAARPDPVAALLRTPADRAARTASRAPRRPALPDVPTAEEIAAAIRHRPAAAVIADICRDLGILPDHPLWQEIMAVLLDRGGYVKFTRHILKRTLAWRTALAEAIAAGGWPLPGSEPATAGSTGPP